MSGYQKVKAEQRKITKKLQKVYKENALINTSVPIENINNVNKETSTGNGSNKLVEVFMKGIFPDG